jgi:hypothetical protein
VWFWSQWTPGQLQGVAEVVFQRRVLPVTAARRVKRAARSEVKSGFTDGRKIVRKKNKSLSL